MNVHVFIVDVDTFKVHLEYMFAGTGAKNNITPFLCDSEAECHWKTEQNLVAMIADISRIRVGDKVIFYLQSKNGNQGQFFGVFKADSLGFFDENDSNNYLVNELGKGLAFRVRISPDCVYPLGITEHEFLDDLSGKEAPHELCWSMIYRKLKANRGCTMITQYEYEDLKAKLEAKNNGYRLTDNYFTYDSSAAKIVPIDEEHPYLGRMNDLDIRPRLLYKAHRHNAFEAHLQALVMQKFDDAILKDKILSLDNNSTWVGNEVSCGVGMQRIDTMIIEENESEIHLRIVEMKDEEPYGYILEEQLPWYLKWASQYIIPNLQKYGKEIIIHPCILARRTSNQDMINRIKNENLISLNMQNVNVALTEYIGFEISDTDILFEKIV